MIEAPEATPQGLLFAPVACLPLCMVPLDILMMLDHAIEFEWAALSLKQTQERNESEWLKSRGRRRPPLVVPYQVLFAFALELYLKTLRRLESGTYNRREHHFERLFNELDQPHRARIEAVYNDFRNEAEQKSPGSGGAPLMEVLRACRHAFVEWRYLFDQPSGQIFTAPPRAVTLAVKQAIAEADGECKAVLEHFAEP